MRLSRLPFWVPIAGLLLPVAVGLGWLMLFFGHERVAPTALPFEYHRDPAETLTVDQVARLPADAWRPEPGIGSSVSGRGNDVVWLRLTLTNPGAEPEFGMLFNRYRYTDRAELWIAGASGWRRLVSGETVGSRAMTLPSREMVFPLLLGARTTQTVYLRMQDHVGVYCRPFWRPAIDYISSTNQRFLAEGVYFGILIALFVYNLLLWLRLQLPSLGWYVLYNLGLGIFILFTRQIPVEAGARVSSMALVVVLSIAASFSTFALAQFSRVFLELRRIHPWADRIVLALAFAQGAGVVAAAINPFFPQVQAMPIAAIGTCATHVVLFLIAILAWRRDVWQARFFVLSFACLFVGSVWSVVTWWHTFITDEPIMGLMLGSALEMLILSLAVAERFAQVQREAVLAQERHANEAEQRRLIEETYAEELEIEVKERTRELEEANADKDRMLSIVGHDLRGPLTGLMRAADETAGDFARETARTGRALLLLIEDLVLWARLRAGTRALAVHPARNVLAPAVALHNALAERGGTELFVEAAEDLRVETDLVLVQTLVRNLLANALKFARSRIVLRAEEAGGSVRFSVCNDGPTLSPEVAARIAADESGPLTASGGLGLRLCREICRALGFKLEARSSPQFGTEFSFTVRAAPASLPLSK